MQNIYDCDKRAISAVGFAEDVNTILQDSQKERDNAVRDVFTGVYNKSYTQILVDSILSQHKEDWDDGKLDALLFFDLDEFKQVNDTYGHVTGDIVIQNFAHLLKKYCAECGIVGRVGGDEFLVFMTDIDSEQIAVDKANQLLDLTTKMGDGRIRCTASVGIAFAPTDGTSYQELYEVSDKAVYRSKSTGGNVCSTSR